MAGRIKETNHTPAHWPTRLRKGNDSHGLRGLGCSESCKSTILTKLDERLRGESRVSTTEEILLTDISTFTITEVAMQIFHEEKWTDDFCRDDNVCDAVDLTSLLAAWWPGGMRPNCLQWDAIEN